MYFLVQKVVFWIELYKLFHYFFQKITKATKKILYKNIGKYLEKNCQYLGCYEILKDFSKKKSIVSPNIGDSNSKFYCTYLI